MSDTESGPDHAEPPPASPPPHEPALASHDPEPAAAAHTAAPRRAGNTGTVAIILSLILFAGLAAGLYYVWSNPDPAASEHVAQLESTVNALTQRVTALEQKPPPPPPPPAPEPPPAPVAVAAPPPPPGITAADLSVVSTRLEQVAARQEALAASQQGEATAAAAETARLADAQKQALASLSDQQKQAIASLSDQQKQALDSLSGQQKQALAALSDRVGKTEHAQADFSGLAARTDRVARLQEASTALRVGEPLGDIPNAPPALARYAKLPPPTETALRLGFPALADQARIASRPDTAGHGFLERSWARMQESVTVRAGDQVIVGNSAAGVLARAQTSLDAGDLPGAVSALAALQGRPADIVHDWIDKARGLIAARDALAGLEGQG